MKEKLYEICEEILGSEEETKKFASYETLEELYEYFLNKLPNLTKDEFEEFICEALDSYEKGKESLGKIDENDFGSVSGGANLRQKFTAGMLGLMSMLTAVPGVGATNGSNVETPSGVSETKSIKTKISETFGRVKNWVKKHPKLTAGITVGAVILAGVGAFLKIKSDKKNTADNALGGVGPEVVTPDAPFAPSAKPAPKASTAPSAKPATPASDAPPATGASTASNATHTPGASTASNAKPATTLMEQIIQGKKLNHVEEAPAVPAAKGGDYLMNALMKHIKKSNETTDGKPNLYGCPEENEWDDEQNIEIYDKEKGYKYLIIAKNEEDAKKIYERLVDKNNPQGKKLFKYRISNKKLEELKPEEEIDNNYYILEAKDVVEAEQIIHEIVNKEEIEKAEAKAKAKAEEAKAKAEEAKAEAEAKAKAKAKAEAEKEKREEEIRQLDEEIGKFIKLSDIPDEIKQNKEELKKLSMKLLNKYANDKEELTPKAIRNLKNTYSYELEKLGLQLLGNVDFLVAQQDSKKRESKDKDDAHIEILKRLIDVLKKVTWTPELHTVKK